MAKPLVMLVPTRGRPQSVGRMAEAWELTGAVLEAELVWITDEDDPKFAEYETEIAKHPWMRSIVMKTWRPMVPKLNRVAQVVAVDPSVKMLGFMGDDHLPRTPGWAAAVLSQYEQHGHGVYYGKDGFQDERLCTWWVVSSQMVEQLGGMVPAPVDHLYCDNAMMMLGMEAGNLRFMPGVLIEHMHPVAGKAETDEGYRRVNRRQQYDRDLAQFQAWMSGAKDRDVRLIENLRGV